MKKRLEAELISIAHRILKLKNVSELKQLHSETQKLYETLSVLKFVEENMNIIQPKIDIEEVEQKLENVFDKPNEILDEVNILNSSIQSNLNSTNVEINEEITHDNEEIITIANKQAIEEESVSDTVNNDLIEEKIIIQPEGVIISNEKIEEEGIIIEKNETLFIPEFEPVKSDKKVEPVQISFDEFKFSEPVFEKKSDLNVVKPTILNEKLSIGINIGLNDKIAFVKHLFGDSNEDYIRVLSQINTFDTYFETVTFINDIVKPDYNNWENKDEYVLRFLESVEKKFV